MRSASARWAYLPLLFFSVGPSSVLAGDVLSTDGFSTCMSNPTIKVTALNLQYDRSVGMVTFNVEGESDVVQNITASMVVSAYGKQVYQKDFNPCDQTTWVGELCPVPARPFSANGSLPIPSNYANMIPSVAYNVPDLDGQAKLELKNADKQDIACIESTVTNGKTMDVPAVPYIAAGIAASALALSFLSAAMNAGNPGAAAPSPTFGEVIGWFQGIATNGMLSVQYPQVYQSFTKNFAFSTGIIPWGQMLTSIDNFRSATGGNLTDNSYAYLKNATLVTTSTGNSNGSLFKRTLSSGLIFLRDDLSENVNGTSATLGSSGSNSTSNGTSTGESKEMHYVKGIQAYVEQLSVPQADTFMTVLIIFAIVVAAITVVILLCKVILEAFSLSSHKLPKALESFRKRYWWRLAKTITNLVLLLYGIWTLYCVYQFTNGDSWAAKALAAVTWAIFTGLLAFFTFKIWSRARQFKRMDGDASQLFENKETWVKYSLFYDSFKKGYWWIFIPAIIYMFARNAVIAAADGHGMAQAIGQMAVEVVMLALLIWTRPYSLKSGNWINIFIQIVRVLSVICILVFVEELGISQTTKTITGVVLIVVQSVLTGVLAILIAVNAIITCVKENPHRRRRKDAEKLNRDFDNLTPLDARNSLLLDSAQLTDYKGAHPDTGMMKAPLVASSLHTTTSNATNPRYDPVPARDSSPTGYGSGPGRDESRDVLMSSAASMGGRDRSRTPVGRAPTLPNVDFGHAY